MNKKRFIAVFVSVLIVFFAVLPGKASAWSGCGPTYVVQWGDTLSGIAAKCGTTLSALYQANPGISSWAYAGQVLQMPDANWNHPEENWNQTGGGYNLYTVVPGDTLKIIAARFGTTWDAIANLNGIYNSNIIYVGQVLRIPGVDSGLQPERPPQQSSNGTNYVVQSGDTLKKLAYRWGVTIQDILAINPQIHNASVIYVGQCISMPGTSGGYSNPGYYTVQRGDTLRIIANKYGTTVYNLQVLNPQIWNPNYIYFGMVIRVY